MSNILQRAPLRRPNPASPTSTSPGAPRPARPSGSWRPMPWPRPARCLGVGSSPSSLEGFRQREDPMATWMIPGGIPDFLSDTSGCQWDDCCWIHMIYYMKTYHLSCGGLEDVTQMWFDDMYNYYRLEYRNGFLAWLHWRISHCKVMKILIPGDVNECLIVGDPKFSTPGKGCMN